MDRPVNTQWNQYRITSNVLAIVKMNLACSKVTLSYHPRAATAIQLSCDLFTEETAVGALAIFVSAKRLSHKVQQVIFQVLQVSLGKSLPGPDLIKDILA